MKRYKLLKDLPTFKAGEEAEKRKRQIEAEYILRQYTKGFVPDWSDRSEQKWYCFFNYGYKDIVIYDSYNNYHNQHMLYFATEEDAKASVKNHRKEWLEYFGIKE